MSVVDYLLHGVTAVAGIIQAPSASVIALAAQAGSTFRQIRAETEIKEQLSTLEKLMRDHTALLESGLAGNSDVQERGTRLTQLFDELKQQFPAHVFMDSQGLAILQGVRARDPESIRKLLALQEKYDVALLPELFGNDFERLSQQQGVTSTDAAMPLDRSKLNIVREESGLYRVYHVPPELIVSNGSSRTVLTDMLGLPLGDSSVVIARDPEHVLEIRTQRFFEDPLVNEIFLMPHPAKERLRKLAILEALGMVKEFYSPDRFQYEAKAYKEELKRLGIKNVERYIQKIGEIGGRILSLRQLAGQVGSLSTSISAEINRRNLEFTAYGFTQEETEHFLHADKYDLLGMYDPRLKPVLEVLRKNPRLGKELADLVKTQKKIDEADCYIDYYKGKIRACRDEYREETPYLLRALDILFYPIARIFFREGSPEQLYPIGHYKKELSSRLKERENLAKHFKEAERRISEYGISQEALESLPYLREHEVCLDQL